MLAAVLLSAAIYAFDSKGTGPAYLDLLMVGKRYKRVAGEYGAVAAVV
jgi:hypothetical protein